ncbi:MULTISPECIES: Cof-type HAD-IIB family hydrolase [unclassified Streptococcus]|uniref:Cof-type HAD-IIB family hydrolase n=1 Tax=unclassified Streptococcus TaxID=2608887 RepID=UPI0018A9D4AC|nr:MULTISPECIES: Cof-type HAD-IIB family hydrolase [unclassified Streptococcus]MBF8970811.1 HAD family phosphatase [Streptococcus sp. NLN76]MBG9367747.1 HAD family phosphatase [Streptococcus sp. NLN64]MBJ6746070.1 HAD family phosphatase [Streptococcus sp. 121]
MDTSKIIALDLDGTLLNDQQQISSKSQDVLKKIQDQGHKIIITTGRPYRSALPYYQQLELETPLITFNGALTTLPGKKWVHEKEYTIDKSYLVDLVDRQEEVQADFIVSEYRKKFFVHQQDVSSLDPQLLGVDKITAQHQLIPQKITKNPNAILFQTRFKDSDGLAQELMNYYQGEMTVSSWGGPYNILECTPKGVHKARALKYLLDLYQKQPAELIAFGDQLNDKEMLAFAGTGYAMQNANTKLIDYADQQIQWTNQEDGVAQQLGQLFL